MNEQPSCWIDIESSGNTDRHQMLEVAAMRVEEGRVVAHYHATVLLEPKALWDPSTQAIHRLNPYSVAFRSVAQPLRDVLWAMDPLLAGALPAGHGVHYDTRMLRLGYTAVGRTPPHEIRHHGPSIDTLSIARELRKTCPDAFGEDPSNSLGALCKMFGLPVTAAHTAAEDIGNTLRLYRRLLPLRSQQALALPASTTTG